MTSLTLRGWQAEFLRALRAHDRDDFLLVACPAAGKTIAAGAAAADLMAERECDQLIAVCPTVVVRNQWQLELGELGYRMTASLTRRGWPEHLHGICTTYAQVALRAAEFAEACARRRTVCVFDEVHHAGQQLAWGSGLEEAFSDAEFRLKLSGTPFRSDGDAIPFVRYGPDGTCDPDFAYDYARAVREGVCRPVEFRAHDGEITWLEGETPYTASFEHRVDRLSRPKRLRAALDPAQPYLRDVLVAANEDLEQLQERIPDAAGLVICDSQAHALAVDRLLNELTGRVPVLAISDLPRAHETITRFTDSADSWLVSVRMVAEGVDIPRLGVIVWATASSTELMVRQVAGRALRGREEFAGIPAVVHMPADQRLVEYAERLDVLGGVSARGRRSWGVTDEPVRRRSPRRHRRSQHRIDPAPFVAWYERQAEIHGARAVCSRLGWGHDTGARRILRWRDEGAWPDVLLIYDACHMAGIGFEDLYEGPEYEDARAFVNDPEAFQLERLDFGCIEATGRRGGPQAIKPALPLASVGPIAMAEPIEISTPELPPSPAEIIEEERAREAARGELFRLLSVYARLRRETTPSYQLATAHAELAGAIGAVMTRGSSDELVAEAIGWVRERAAEVAAEHPDVVKSLARRRRRHAIALAATEGRRAA
jgi:superfamily II DNA or RNA helicase